MTVADVGAPFWQITFLGEDESFVRCENRDEIMDALVEIAEGEAARELGPDADYEAHNDRTLRLAETARRILLEGFGQRHAGSLREPHLYPVRYAVASIGGRVVCLSQFERSVAA